jgi:hypothetical protein
LHKCLIDSRLWAIFSILVLGFYLSPLFHSSFYVPTFDNLDSTVVWYKILAHSGKIFADNHAIIPNMMSGLPRASYGSEFNIQLWLYYFFTAKTAFIINEVLMHIVAFFSAFIFLKRYVVWPNRFYGDFPVYAGALYFATLPFWAGAGLSLPLLPLVTYALLNIKNSTDTKWDWILILLLPLYTSFIFLYMFYVVLGGIYWLAISLHDRSFHRRLFLALFLMGVMFLLKEYRLILSHFFDHGIVSHRTEFDIFFKDDLWECYRLTLVKFLDGHVPHAQSLQMEYLLPLALIALLLSFIHRRLVKRDSFIVWTLILSSILIGLWPILLIHRYTLPTILLLALFAWYFAPRYRLLPSMIILVILLSAAGSIFEYEGLHWLAENFPIFKALNLIRIYFVNVLIFLVVFSFTYLIFLRKTKYALPPLVLLLLLQLYNNSQHSFYRTQPEKGYASFETYYAPKTFHRLLAQLEKNDHDFDTNGSRFVSFGMEPAVALYNGLYTVDGYSTNYPISYKHAFRKVFAPYHTSKLYDIWGSKVYIASITSDKKYYIKDLNITKLRFDTKALCRLHTDYILSPYRFVDPSFADRVVPVASARGPKNSWDLYLYKLHCRR